MSAKDELIKSPTAKYIIDRMVDPVYETSEYACAMFEIIGTFTDWELKMIEDIAAQGNIATATWGLSIWADEYGVDISPGMSYEEIRRLINRKKNNTLPPNETNLRNYIKEQTGHDTEIIQNVGPYKFAVNFLRNFTEEPFNYHKVYKTVKEARQAHLCFECIPSIKHDYKLSEHKYIIRFKPRLTGTLFAGTFPSVVTFGQILRDSITVEAAGISKEYHAPVTGLKPNPVQTLAVGKSVFESLTSRTSNAYINKTVGLSQGVERRTEFIEEGIKSRLKYSVPKTVDRVGPSRGEKGSHSVETQTKTYEIVNTYCGENL